MSSLVDRAVKQLKGELPVIDSKTLDWQKYLKPSDRAKVIPAENLTESLKNKMLLENSLDAGLVLPWSKTHDTVRLRDGKLIVWTGWGHHGKSAMTKMTMLQAIAQGYKVFMASMEETPLEVLCEMARMFTGGPEPTPAELDRFIEFYRGHLFLYDHQGVANAKKMIAITRCVSAELGCDQVVLDSLMMMGCGREDYESQTEFLNELKATGKDTGATCHLVAHMRKQQNVRYAESQPGSQHDISGPHEISSIADTIIQVWRNKTARNDRKETDVQEDGLVIVEKQRGDPNWIGTVRLDYHQPSRQLIDVGRKIPIRWTTEQ